MSLFDEGINTKGELEAFIRQRLQLPGNLLQQLLAQVGFSRALSIPGAESTTSTSYTTLATPDLIESVPVGANALVMLAYQAIWQNTVASNARAAVFLDSVQLKAGSGSGSPVATDVSGPAEVNDDGLLFTFPTAAAGLSVAGGVGAATEVTTGQLLSGGAIAIFAAPGTYDVSVKFKNNAAGTTTVKNRRMWVWTLGF